MRDGVREDERKFKEKTRERKWRGDGHLRDKSEGRPNLFNATETKEYKIQHRRASKQTAT